ncbi:hypothetical protein ElyMa_001789400 [Elysia marginata]|uniref:DUF4200 domain-containing protein n=1 Tax=Elysia marginata TaxID=1093978 RepID=A0AAV4EDT3_9GAST|nr:hypothetical protein ElyMa_001789400 [Elysia marginata]
MSVAEPFTLTHELDQMLVQYRKHLKRLSPLWAQASELGRCGNVVVALRAADDMLGRLEQTVTSLMDKSVLVERARQEVLDLKASLSISRQTVDAKSRHLGQEERQKEEEQGLRFKEFKRIHRFQDEKAALEKELMPARRRLTQISETLDEKSEKMRNLENFYDALSDHCDQGLTFLKEQTDLARAQRAKWDKLDLDIGKEVREFPLDNDRLIKLDENVRELSNTVQHHKQWYEEEMQTKLFYSTRSKEIKHKLAYCRSVLRRMETSGRSEDVDEDTEGRRLSRRSENILVDGSPGVEAKEVENYLSRQFGMRVLADYTMLKRLKDEIGVKGLAYLVEKVRLLGDTTSGDSQATTGVVTGAPAFADWEEQKVEQALMGIALEYRDSDENKRLLHPVNQSASPTAISKRSSSLRARSDLEQTKISTPTGQHISVLSPTSTATDASPSSRDGSNSSLRQKSSLARLRKLFKF